MTGRPAGVFVRARVMVDYTKNLKIIRCRSAKKRKGEEDEMGMK